MASSSIELRLHSIEQGYVFCTYQFDPSTPTKKWHTDLSAFAKQKWAESGKQGTVQSFPYVGTRHKKGNLPPALWSSANLQDGDIIHNGTKEFKYTVKESSGKISVPPSVEALLKAYFGDAEHLVIFTFVP